MAKINEMAVVLEELKHCGESLICIAEKLSDIFPMEVEKSVKTKRTKKTAEPAPEETNEEPQEETPADEPEVQLTLVEVRVVLSEKSRAEYTDEVKDLIAKYSVQKLSDIAPENYSALLADTEVLGNE